MATVTKPIALDESFNTTEQTPRNIADVLAEGLSHITGRTASEVEYDNSESGLTSDDVQGAIDELSERPTLPTTDIQTAVDEFETYNGGLLSECKVALSPNQDLHGYENPWVGGASKNKFDISSYSTLDPYVTVSDGNIRVNGSGSFRVARYNSLYLAQGTYTLSFKSVIVSGTEFIAVLKSNDTFIFSDNGVTITNYSRTFTIPENGTYKFAIGSATNDSADITFSDIQIELGSTATAYEPYSNICPISGHTQVEVDVSDGQTTQEQVTVNLGGTYYGGTLDVVSGELTVDSAFIASYNGETLPSTWISDRDVYAVGTTPTTGAEVCYKLATPTPIQLSPTMVKALVGENHLSAPLEGQEITESEYRELFTWDEVESYVNAHSGGGSGMNYSTNEQVIGTWIDSKPLYQKTITHSGALTVDNTFSNDIGTLANVDQFVKCEGYFRRTDANGLMYSLNGGTRPEDGADSYKVTTRFFNGQVQVAVKGYTDIEYIALTVQYTKTTD